MTRKSFAVLRCSLELVGTVIVFANVVGCGATPKPTSVSQLPSRIPTSSNTSLILNPVLKTVETAQAIAFSAPFAGPWSIQWSVNGIPGGNSVVGIIDSSGRYTAPLIPPTNLITLTASLPDAEQDPGALTASSTFNVINPVPLVTQVSPSTIPLGSSPVQLTITGTGFNPLSTVTLDGESLSSVCIDPQHLTMDIPVSFVSVGHVWTVEVSNVSPGGGTSAASTFTVLNPQPNVSSITPSAFFAADQPSTLNVVGSGFIPNSQVSIKGHSVSTTFVSPNQLHISLTAGLLSAGSIPVLVTNVGPGGGASQRSLDVMDGRIMSTSNAQVAKYVATIPDASTFAVRFGQQDFSLTTASIPAPPGGGEAVALVAGMKSSSEYHLRPEVTLHDGSVSVGPDQTFTTGSLTSDQIPVLVVSKNSLPESEGGVELLDFVTQKNPNQLMIAVSDLSGNVIWYYQPEITGAYALPIRQLSNSDFLVSLATAGGTSGVSKVVREIDLSGQIIKQVTLDQVKAALNLNLFAFHHDVIALPNGHWILLAQEYKTYTDLPGFPGQIEVLGDVLIDVDQNMNPVWSWSSFDHLDVNRHPMSFPDWTHGNALFYDHRDGNLLISMRHQSWVLKIDYEDGTGDGHVLWRLGPDGDFNLEGGDPTQWFYAQHYPNIVSRDQAGFKLAVMDNGNMRPIDKNGDLCGIGQMLCYSRAILMDVDEQARNVSVRWSFAPGLFSFFGGNADLLQNGDVEATFAAAGPGVASAIYEVDASDSIVWQMNTTGAYAYRAVRLPSLYPSVKWP